MAQKLPYMATPGTVPKVLNKIIEAKTPERFTSDFLETRLGFKGGSSRAIIPLLKRIGFLTEDGTPTTIYKGFRNEAGRGKAMAEALRRGYSELFDRSEYAGDLDRKGIADLVNEVTGNEKGSQVDTLTVSTFVNLREFADFDAEVGEAALATPSLQVLEQEPPYRQEAPQQPPQHTRSASSESLGLNLAYTINLNLPETTNIEVYNAIFASLKRNLLGS